MKVNKSKRIEETLFKVLMWVAMAIVFGFVISVIWTVFSRGAKAMSWDMITKLPGGGFYIGKEGGFLNAIVGSLYIVGASTLIGLLISIPVVFYLNVYLKKDSRLAYIARLAFDVLFGMPSIVWRIRVHHYDLFRAAHVVARWYHRHHPADYSHFHPLYG